MIIVLHIQKEKKMNTKQDKIHSIIKLCTSMGKTSHFSSPKTAIYFQKGQWDDTNQTIICWWPYLTHTVLLQTGKYFLLG